MLTGKIALVTGASRGIGCEIALSFARAGAFVAVNYNSNAKAARDVVSQIKSEGGAAAEYCCDVSDFEACKDMTAAVVRDYGRLDILVNNAGITRDGLLSGMKEEDFDAVLETNLKGCFNMLRHASRYMIKQRGGKIINISSVSGVLGNAGQANYSAAKAGIIGLTKSAARELAARNILVNAVAPGFVYTDMTRQMPEKTLEAALAQIPLHRMGTPEDVAKVVLFLAGEGGDYMTGQVLCVDGGMAI
ncbi:MAG: 3-oxoacyl-[acyl-carrier-protein] reductase [Roseburia sp.]|nr:3-oxoacyl-[acyl-carrier-protein] reductase [Roseburia sp.]